jgi:hypothetical protein
MPHDVSPERVAALAAGVRVSLTHEDAVRIARAASPMLARFADGKITMPMETEPSTFSVVQHKDAGR